MIPILVNQCRSARMPRAFLTQWISILSRELSRHRIAKKELVIVFVDARTMRAMNKQFRAKDYATDVLSFEGVDSSSLGELVICPQVLRKQCLDTGFTFQQELAYMVLHGVLHLLGMDHETGESDARRMFALQDRVFEKATLALGAQKRIR